MATRAATFTAKIRTLNDYHYRVRHGILPLPSGMDIANTLKYFSQTLLSVLKDVPSIPLEMMRNKDQDHMRMSLFPSLDYKAFYQAIVQLVDIIPLIQSGVQVLGHGILHTMICAVPFLEHEMIDTLPYLVASTMAIFPEILHKEIIDTICNYLLPFSITNTDARNYANLSTAAIIMTIFQYSKTPSHHCQLLECLMSLKADITKDLLCVIAHGTSEARAAAANLLFHYWPSLNPLPYERKGIQPIFNGWPPRTCQRENCLSAVNNEAIKMCLDPLIAIGTGDHPPPLYICQDCADQIRRENEDAHFHDALLPIEQVSLICDNKNCRSMDKTALFTCFSTECASYNGNRPTRYCTQCHTIRHNNRRGGDHIVHTVIGSPWLMDPELQVYMVEAIISLLKEAQPIADKTFKELGEHHVRLGFLKTEMQIDSNVLEERRMLSRYGIYLLVGHCAPTEDTPVETLGRLLAMVFQWFYATAYLRDDQIGGVLERLKSEYVHNWLLDIAKSHFDVFVSCLLPHPPNFARVGGHWDYVTSKIGHIKDGFSRLFCLVPYEIISLEIWECIMPHWMEAIRNEVAESELSQLKILLSKVLDPEMSPLGFDGHQMYGFLTARFKNTTTPVQEQALVWLQILCLLDIVVPLSLLFTMFNDGIKATNNVQSGHEPSQSIPKQCPPGRTPMHSSIISTDGNVRPGADSCPTSPLSSFEKTDSKPAEPKSDAELNLPCFVSMLDILLRQMELQDVDPHLGMDQIMSREAMSLIQEMIKAPWEGTHTCKDKESIECIYCETITILFQLSLEIVEYISPPLETAVSQQACDGTTDDSEHIRRRNEKSPEKIDYSKAPGEGGLAVAAAAAVIAMTQRGAADMIQRNHESSLPEVVQMPILTATVQTVNEAPLQTVGLIATEEVERAVAQAVTLSDVDVGVAKVSIVQTTVVDENEQSYLAGLEVPGEDQSFWHTSQGKFKIALDELPIHLQLIYVLLKEIPKYDDPDVLYHLLSCLKILALHAECLSKAAKEHRGFLIWCQENLLINNLWNQLQSEYSHVAQLSVQMLTHCITLPAGADTFWKVVEDDFHSEDWKVRFASVERVTVVARFLDPVAVTHSQALQSSMANAFTYLISSVDDINPTVAEKAILFLDTIKDSALSCLTWCLEVQFDTVIVDRPMILQTLYQLYNSLPDRNILSWDFFINRFDTLFLEAQLFLEKSGDLSFPRDLKNTDSSNEVFVQKLNRAQEAINQSATQSVRSLTSSQGTKLRYKRAMSAPGGMICKQEKPVVDKEKLFGRQSSAPILKRKYSKFGIGHPQASGQFPNHLFPDGHIKDQLHDEHSFRTMFHKVLELDDRDQDTMHLLIFLFMQFLSHPNHAFPSDEKMLAKTQNIVLRHLSILLGFSPQDKCFCISPSKMRTLPMFNSFLANLPRVLDRNFKMGTVLLPMCLPLLQYCPAPSRSSSEAAHLNYSLWCLESHSRHAWLVSVCVLLYKYRYNSPPLPKQVNGLVRIVLNSLEAHYHRCKRPSPSSVITTASTLQARELGMMSAAELGHIQEWETPPCSPGGILGESAIITMGPSGAEGKVHYQRHGITVQDDDSDAGLNEHLETRWKGRKYADYILAVDADEVEPELEVIPESPKSESPQPENLQGSLGELSAMGEHARAEKAVMWTEAEGYILNEVSSDQPATGQLASITVEKGVEMQMANQLQAFNDSFDKLKSPGEASKRLSSSESPTEISDTKLSPAKESCKMIAADDRESQTSSDESREVFIREVTVHSDSVYIAKLVRTTMPPMIATSTVVIEDQSQKRSNVAATVMSSAGSSTSIDEESLGSEAKGRKYVQLPKPDQVTMPPSKFKMEVLDPSQLEQIVRREPTIVAQKPPIPSYLFQPIQTHPITKDSAKVDAADGRHIVGQPIKVEPKRTPSLEHPDTPLTPTQTLSQQTTATSTPKYQATVPWTIEVHSPIRLQSVAANVPSPERLLPVGPPSRAEVMPARPAVAASDPTSRWYSPASAASSSEKPTAGNGNGSGPTSLFGRVWNTLEGWKHSGEPSEITASDALMSVVTDGKSPCSTLPSLDAVTIVEKPALVMSDSVSVSVVTTSTCKPTMYEQLRVISAPTTGGPAEIKPKRSSFELAPVPQLQVESSRTLPLPVAMTSRPVIEPLTSTADVQGVIPVRTPSISRDAYLVPQPAFLDRMVPTPEPNLGVSQRLYPTYRLDARTPDTTFFKSPCPSPRLTKAYDSHLDALYQSTGSVEAINLEPHDHDVSSLLGQEKLVHRYGHDHDESKGKSHFRPRRQRKPAIGSLDGQKLVDIRNASTRKSRKGEFAASSSGSKNSASLTSKCSEDTMVMRCGDCGSVIESYSDEELGLSIVILSTYIHREPVFAAPLLPEILHTVARIATSVMYPWEVDSNVYLPGNARSIARQFLRCVLHQLAPSGVFLQIFQTKIEDPEFFKTIAFALSDFNELNPMAPLMLLLEGLNEKKNLPTDTVPRVMSNMAAYLDCLQLEASSAAWATILPQFDVFLRRLSLALPTAVDMTPTMKIFCSILKIPGLHSFKSILDPFSKILSFIIQNCYFQYQHLLDVCHLCNRAFSKERDKLFLSRMVVFDLVQTLKFKTNIPDKNLLMLVQFVVQDAGGTLGPSIILEDIGVVDWELQNMMTTSSAECMRQYLTDAMDFIADVHTLSKIKSNFKGTLVGLNEDTLGGAVKAGIAQYLALEFTRGNNREMRSVNRYLPWLYNTLPAAQQGPREFIDCVTHIRLLSWLLLGALIHIAVIGGTSSLICQPIPLEASSHVADHIQVIFAGFAEQSKASVLHMSSLFHAFILCQLWTMYCEQLAALNNPSGEYHHAASLTISDFWAKVTPGILQLLAHSKVLAEMVTLHFLSLMEGLLECNSTVLAKLFPMWKPVLNSYRSQLASHLLVRLQACENRPPPTPTRGDASLLSGPLLKWLQRLQFKMGQIELQSSAAIQFYTV